MKFSLEKGSGNVIHSYAPGELKIRQDNEDLSQPEQDDTRYRILASGSLLLTMEILITPWLPADLGLSAAAMQTVVELRPEVILLGTGQTMRFPEAAILRTCHVAQIGVEVMNTAAACRTYNVLAAERRRVCLALTEI